MDNLLALILADAGHKNGCYGSKPPFLSDLKTLPNPWDGEDNPRQWPRKYPLLWVLWLKATHNIRQRKFRAFLCRPPFNATDG
jgi:hypothetical protein